MIYLDNAATTWPKPISVYKAVMNCMKNYCGNPGRSGHKMAVKCAEKIYETRVLLCKLFNGEKPMNFIFTSGATESLNLAIIGLLKKNDHVITTKYEHNSVLRPLKSLENKGITTTFLDCCNDNATMLKHLKSCIRANTRMIITTHVSNVTGEILPVKDIGKIARDNNIYYLVDAAQSAGYIPIDIQDMNIDILAASGHKGLFGLQGTGFIYISDNIKAKPLKYGGTGSESENTLQPNIIPDMYESGTLNTPGIVGLGAGLKFILSNGLEEIREYEQDLISLIIEKLTPIKGVKLYGPQDVERITSIVSFNINDLYSAQVCNMLDTNYEIAVRSGIHCAPLIHESMSTIKKGTVRLSISCFNTRQQIIGCIKAIDRITKESG